MMRTTEDQATATALLQESGTVVQHMALPEGHARQMASAAEATEALTRLHRRWLIHQVAPLKSPGEQQLRLRLYMIASGASCTLQATIGPTVLTN